VFRKRRESCTLTALVLLAGESESSIHLPGKVEVLTVHLTIRRVHGLLPNGGESPGGTFQMCGMRCRSENRQRRGTTSGVPVRIKELRRASVTQSSLTLLEALNEPLCVNGCLATETCCRYSLSVPVIMDISRCEHPGNTGHCVVFQD